MHIPLSAGPARNVNLFGRRKKPVMNAFDPFNIALPTFMWQHASMPFAPQ
jgi:hypothetical protein